jgi:hypothetical protein
VSKNWNLVQEAMIFEDGEEMIRLWPKVMYFKPQRQIRGDFMLENLKGKRGRRYREEVKTTFEDGLFLLTNRRVIWLKKQGLLKKSIQPQYSIRLDDLIGVSYKGRITKKLLLSTSDRQYEYKMRGADKTVEYIKEQKARARAKWL